MVCRTASWRSRAAGSALVPRTPHHHWSSLASARGQCTCVVWLSGSCTRRALREFLHCAGIETCLERCESKHFIWERAVAAWLAAQAKLHICTSPKVYRAFDQKSADSAHYSHIPSHLPLLNQLRTHCPPAAPQMHSEESTCRFCCAALPDWRAALTPPHEPPPAMVRGSVHQQSSFLAGSD